MSSKRMSTTLLALRNNWKMILMILIPIIFSFLAVNEDKKFRCAYVLVVVASYWITEVIDIAVTSFLPIILLPTLRILTPAKVASCYMKEIALLLIGGLIVAKCIEQQKLHRRIALRVLLLAGPNPIWQYLGFMIATWFLSMWISNTATTAMMVTIALAVLIEMSKLSDLTKKEEHKTNANPEPTESYIEVDADSVSGSVEVPSNDPNINKYAKGLLISIAYASASGGICTLTGTGPNIVMYGYITGRYGDKAGLNFGTYMAFGIPVSAMCLLVTWIVLCIRFIGIKKIIKRNVNDTRDERIKTMLREQCEKLGSIKFGEIAALILFGILVLLWILREPGVPLWGALFIEKNDEGKPIKYWTDAVSAILISFIIFIFPAENPFKKRKDPVPKLLNWPLVQKEFPWMLIFLFGAGFALAAGCEESGLSTAIGQYLTKLQSLNLFVIVLCLTLGISLLTEVTSNTATSTILLPIIIKMAECININPMIPVLAATLACSLAFCLPVATPPNAIIFSTGRIKVVDLLSCGVILNFLCVSIVTIFSYYYTSVVFNHPYSPQSPAAGNCTF